MPKVCPYMSTIRWEQLEKVICIEDECEIWDLTNERCGTKVSDTIINRNNNEQDNLISMLEKVLGKSSERDQNNSLLVYLQDIIGIHQNKQDASNGETLLTLANHEHDSHSHMYPHFCHNIPSNCGWGTAGAGFATVLIGEFHSNEDLDNNGKIYGKDFKILDDPQKPPILKSLEYTPYWVEPTEIITWDQYVQFGRGL